MKDFLCFAILIAAAIWFFRGWTAKQSEQAKPSAPAERREIVIAPVSDQRDASWDTTLAEDDKAMAAERLNNWLRQTSGKARPTPQSAHDDE